MKSLLTFLLCFALFVPVFAQDEAPAPLPLTVEAPINRIIVVPSGTMPGSNLLIGIVVKAKVDANIDENDTVIYQDNSEDYTLNINGATYHSIRETSIVLIVKK